MSWFFSDLISSYYYIKQTNKQTNKQKCFLSAYVIKTDLVTGGTKLI